MDVDLVLRVAANALELAATAVIVLGAVAAAVSSVRTLRSGAPWMRAYRAFRRGLGQAILIGLELLVAGDILRTVEVRFRLDELAGLGALVLVRSFLGLVLEIETEGRWPWQRADPSMADASG